MDKCMWIHNEWQSVRNISNDDFLYPPLQKSSKLGNPLLFVNITGLISVMLHNVAKDRELVRLSLRLGRSISK